MIRAIIRSACLVGLTGTLIAAPLHDHSATVAVQIIKGAKYQFRQPYELAEAGGNVWAFNESCRNTLVRASNGAFVRSLVTAKNICAQTSYAVSGNDVWTEGVGRGDRFNLVDLKGSTGSLVRKVQLPGTLTSDTPALMTATGSDIWISTVGDAAGTFEVSLSTGDLIRSLPEPGSIEPDCLLATTSRVWTDAASTVYEYSAATGHQLRSVELPSSGGAYPFNMILLGSDLWVPDGSTLYVINATSMHVVAELPGKSHDFDDVQGVATNGQLVWALSALVPKVVVFTAKTRSLRVVLQGIRYGLSAPSAITWYDGRVWVANQGHSGVGSLSAFT